MKSQEYEAKGDYFKREAVEYDAIRFSSFKGRYYAKLQKEGIQRALAGLPAGFSVLDLPCGTGRISVQLNELTPNITCGDISTDMLEVSRQKLSPINTQVSYRVLDAEKIDFPDNTFDAVCTIKLMHLLPIEVQQRVLKEIIRVSRKRVVVTYAYSDGLSWIKDYIFRKKYDKVNPSSDHPRRVVELQREIEAAGGVVKDVIYTFRLFSAEVIFAIDKR